MKTDLSTLSQYPKNAAPLSSSKAAKTLPVAGGKLPESGINTPRADYKVELSGARPTPSPLSAMPDLPLPPLPSLPSAPTPSISKADTPKLEGAVKEVAKEEVKIVKKEVKEGSLKKPLVVFIKGLDIFSSPLKSERGYAGVGKMAESVEGARIYGHDQKKEIIEEIKKTHRDYPVILVGHSFGGDTAVEITNELDSLEHNFRKIDLLVTMDAVGFGNKIIPQNVKEHLNIFGENDFLLNDGPHVGRRHEMTNVKNILSPLNHTDIDDDKEVQFEVMSLIQDTLVKNSPHKV